MRASFQRRRLARLQGCKDDDLILGSTKHITSHPRQNIQTLRICRKVALVNVLTRYNTDAADRIMLVTAERRHRSRWRDGS